jgi:hypothetical protein
MVLRLANAWRLIVLLAGNAYNVDRLRQCPGV